MNSYLKLTVLLVPLSAVVLFGFNNCGRFGGSYDSGSQDSSSLGSAGDASGDDVNSEKLGLPYALLSAEQTLSSMMKVANVTAPTNALLNEYNGRYGALAAGNDLSMANGPLMLGATSLAGEVCNNLLTQEKAITDASARNFFTGINFAAGVSTLSDTGYDIAIRGMARSFWGRNETQEEYELLRGYRTEFVNALAANARTQAASTNNLMLSTCAAMLSSMEAISY